MLETDDTNDPATPDETQATTRPKRAPRKAAAKKAAPPAEEQAQAAAPEPVKKAPRARKAAATRLIMTRIAELLPPRQRGVYAANVEAAAPRPRAEAEA